MKMAFKGAHVVHCDAECRYNMMLMCLEFISYFCCGKSLFEDL